MSDQVGVFVCCHSWLQWVGDAVQSILGQTHRDVLVTIVQDGYDPIEPEAQLGMERHAKHAHIGWFGLATNCGISRVRNEGYLWALDNELSWVTSLDDDDMLNPRYVERMLQAAASRPDVDIWYPNYTTFGDENEFGKAHDFDFDLLRQGNFIISTSFVKPKVWEAVREANGTGFDNDLVERGMRWEDYLFWLEAAALGFKFAPVGTGGLVRVRRHGGSGSEIANSTIPQWRAYVGEKMQRLYGVEMWPSS